MAVRNPAAVASAVGGALLWGTLGPVAALLESQERLAAGAIRLAIGAVIVVIVAGGRPLTAVWRRADLWPLAVGAAGVAGFQVSYFGAIGLSGVAVSTALAIGLSPVFTGLWTWLRTRERPSVGWLTGTTLAVLGLALLSFGGGAAVHASLPGLGLSVLAAAFFSMQAVAIQTMTVRHNDATALTGMFAISSLVLAPAALITATPGLFSGTGILAVLYLGIVTTGCSYWLFARGVRHLGASAAVTITLLEPAGAAVIAAVLLAEPVSAGQWVGIGLICGAVAVIGLAGTRRTVTAIERAPARQLSPDH